MASPGNQQSANCIGTLVPYISLNQAVNMAIFQTACHNFVITCRHVAGECMHSSCLAGVTTDRKACVVSS